MHIYNQAMIMEKFKGLIFDLDGVLVDTAKYHFIAWRDLAYSLNIPFNEEDNERLKGVSRMRCMDIILEIGSRCLKQEEKEYYCAQKNAHYVRLLQDLGKNELFPGVRTFINNARELGYLTALGSASKNSMLILERLEITDLFDVIIDGIKVSLAKPNPKVFLDGAKELGLAPSSCIVFEDAASGIVAAHNGGMKAVGIGTKEHLPEADIVLPGLDGITIEAIVAQL